MVGLKYSAYRSFPPPTHESRTEAGMKGGSECLIGHAVPRGEGRGREGCHGLWEVVFQGVR